MTCPPGTPGWKPVQINLGFELLFFVAIPRWLGFHPIFGQFDSKKVVMVQWSNGQVHIFSTEISRNRFSSEFTKKRESELYKISHNRSPSIMKNQF